jgi:Tfp pilus assembly protein PilO
MKSSDKAIVLGVLMAVVLAAFYFMILSPKRDKASQLEKDISGLKAQVAQEEQVAEFGEQARKQFPTYYGRLVVLGKAVPAGADTSSLLVELSSIAHRTDVEFGGIELSAGDGSASSSSTTSTSTASTPTPSSSSTETSTPTSSASGSTASSGATTPTATAPATEASAANLPLGATVGTAGLATMPYSLTFTGSYFQVADFLAGVDRLIHTRGATQVAADGRLMTIDAFSLSEPKGNPSDPTLKVSIAVTSYVAPASQGLTAGATPSGPAPSVTPTQPASATVTP